MRVDDLERGDLPAVCAKTGVPCDGLVKDNLRVVPAWVAALVYAGVVPFLVLRLYFSRRVEARLPISPARVQRIRSLVRASWIAVVLAAAGLASALFGSGAVGAVALLVGVVAYLGIMAAGDLLWVGVIREPPARRRDPLPRASRVRGALAAHYEARATDERLALPSGY